MNSTMSQDQYVALLNDPDKFQEILDKEQTFKLVELAPQVYEDKDVKDLASLIFYLMICKNQTTYTEGNKTQCTAFRMRSIDDAYLVAKHYNLDCDFKQIKEVINMLSVTAFKEITGSNYSILSKSFCSTVYKMVYTPRITITNVETMVKILESKNMNYGVRKEELEKV